MPIAFKCPKCSKVFKVKDELAGKVVGCPCGAKFRVPQSKPQAAAPSAQTPPSSPAPEEKVITRTPPPPPPPTEKTSIPESSEDDFDATDAGAGLDDDGAMDFGNDDDADTYDDDSQDESDNTQDVDEEDLPAQEDSDKREESDEESGENKDSDLEEENEDEEESEAAPKSLVGRILIFLGAACLIAGLFLPWTRMTAGQTKPAKTETTEAAAKTTAETTEEKEYRIPEPVLMTAPAPVQPVFVGPDGSLRVLAADGEDAPVAPAAPAANDSAAPAEEETEAVKPAAKIADGKEYAGFEIPLDASISGQAPLVYAIFGSAGAAFLLLILALIPGKILSGTIQMLLGLILSLAVPAAMAVGLFGVTGPAGLNGDLVGLITKQADLGMYLSLGGSVVCFLGGLIASFGVFKVPAKPSNGSAKKAKSERKDRSGGRDRSARASASGTERSAASRSGASRSATSNSGSNKPTASSARPGRGTTKMIKPARASAASGAAKKPAGLKPPVSTKKKKSAGSRRAVLKPGGNGGAPSQRKR